MYQGSKADRERGARQTSKGWQRFQTTREYLPFVEAVFGKGNVSLKGSIITATKTYADEKSQVGVLGAPRISDEDALDDAIYMDSVDRNDYEMAEEALERVAARYGVENPELVVRTKTATS